MATPAPPQVSLRQWSHRARNGLVIGGSAILVAAVVATLVVALVVVPHQRAAAALAASASAVQEAHDRAVNDFKTAAGACDKANSDLAATIKKAKDKLSTDPSTMNDPSLIANLKAAIPVAEAAPRCTYPAMASDTDTIQGQASAIRAATAATVDANSALVAAVAVVDSSVEGKKAAAEASAEAAAASASAAAAEARTWHYKSADGYSFDLTMSVGAPRTSGTLGEYATPAGCNTLTDANCKLTTVAVGEGCGGFDAKTMIAIPVDVTLTATTKDFDTRVGASFKIGVSGDYSGPNNVGYDFLSRYVQEETVYSSGPDCASVGDYSPSDFGVSWPKAVTNGESRSFRFEIIIAKWVTPNAPTGDAALLDWITVSPVGTTPTDSGITYNPGSAKSMTLKGDISGG